MTVGFFFNSHLLVTFFYKSATTLYVCSPYTRAKPPKRDTSRSHFSYTAHERMKYDVVVTRRSKGQPRCIWGKLQKS